VEVVNAEEAAMEELSASLGLGVGVYGFRYHEMIYQWSKKRGAGLLFPRTVMVTEEGELIVLVEDFRQDVSLPLPPPPIHTHTHTHTHPTGGGGEEERRGEKFSALPAKGEKRTVLLRVPLTSIVSVTEEESDPRHITLTVRESGYMGGFSSLVGVGTHTWRFFSEDRRKIDALTRVLRE
jgi:hypothetical protein